MACPGPYRDVTDVLDRLDNQTMIAIGIVTGHRGKNIRKQIHRQPRSRSPVLHDDRLRYISWLRRLCNIKILDSRLIA